MTLRKLRCRSRPYELAVANEECMNRRLKRITLKTVAQLGFNRACRMLKPHFSEVCLIVSLRKHTADAFALVAGVKKIGSR